MKDNTKRNKKKSAKCNKRRWIWLAAALGVVVVAVSVAMGYLRKCSATYEGEEVRIYVPKGATEQDLADTLRVNLGEAFAGNVLGVRRWRNAPVARAHGSYVVSPGMTAADLSRRLQVGAQDPVRVTFNNVRTMQQLAERLSTRLEMTGDEFIAACDSVLPALGFDKASQPAAFLPDTYEFYWSADAPYVVRRLVDVRNKFWNDQRLAQAQALGLTPEQVAVVASIVEEETAKADERPKVARLYLNRLDRGMRLQADPTVKYAYGDFTIRRITNKHLTTESPYNTYLHEGLPPGPIRIAERQTLIDVLEAPMHEYIYMCAKEDFSGYHNFAVSGAEHQANARRYHQALNARGIR